jgi:hypothetical protein
MNIKTKLKVGDIVDIYTDYQDENKTTYEGKAVLVKKIRNGDSFYRNDEYIKVEEKKKYNKYERVKLEKYHKLKSLFYGSTGPPEKEVVKFRKELVSCRKDSIDDIENMTRVITTYKHKYSNSPRRIKTILDDFEDDYIIRFIQQDREKWYPTIYTYERWLVDFKEDKTGWNINFKAERNIRLLVKINPNELSKSADIRKYTTYNNGISSLNLFNRDDLDEDDEDLENPKDSESFDDLEDLNEEE